MIVFIKNSLGEFSYDLDAAGVVELMARARELEGGAKEPVKSEPNKKSEVSASAHGSRTERKFGKRETWELPTEIKESVTSCEPEDGYKGFLLVRCPECGEDRAFCVKQPITYTSCHRCGAKIELKALRPAYLNCTCGGSFRYETNIGAERFTLECLNCKKPVELAINSRDTAFTTVQNSRGGGNTPYYPRHRGRVIL